jgi:hypothetical protein
MPSSVLPQALLGRSSWRQPSDHSMWSDTEAVRAVTSPMAHTSAWPAVHQLRHNRAVVITRAGRGLSQQKYLQALEEYAAEDEQYWQKRLKDAGIKPLTEQQQRNRWVLFLLAGPVGLCHISNCTREGVGSVSLSWHKRGP